MRYPGLIGALLVCFAVEAQQPILDRIDRFQGNGVEVPHEVISDNAGGYYYCGSLTDSIDLDPGVSQSWLVTTNGGCYLARYDQSGQLLWHYHFDDGYTSILDIESDSAGNLYIAGLCNGTLTFDSQNNFYFTNTGGSHRDILVAKFNPWGSVAWAKVLDELNTVPAVNYAGTLLLYQDTLCFGGYFKGSIDFDCDTSQFILQGSASINTASLYIAKWDTSCHFVNAIAIPSSSVQFSMMSLAKDDRNNVYAAGQVRSPLDFGPVTISGGLTFDCFIARYNCNLQYEWVYSMGTAAEDQYLTEMRIAHSTIILCGRNPRTTDFDIGSSTHPIYGADLFVAAYDTAMNFKWGASVGNNDNSTSVAQYALEIWDSVVFIGGQFTGTMDLDPSPSSFNIVANSIDYVAFYSSYNLNTGIFCTGNKLTSSPSANTYVRSIFHDDVGYLSLAVGFNGTIDADLTSGTSNITSGPCNDPNAVPYDAAVFKYQFLDVGVSSCLNRESGITTFPNPASDFISIQSDSATIATVKLFDYTGRLLATEEGINCRSCILDISMLSSGAYIIRIRDEKGMETNQTILIQR